MKKGEQLIWTLFEMVKELLPVTEANTRRFTEWAEKFHELEHGSDDRHQAVDVADHDEPAEDPHEHGSPTRRRRK
jgi:hypothetical protein